jgi:predicted MFS family arabinose efflux permease
VLEVASVFKDKIFWIFLFVSFVTAMIFFQLFTTLPLYHSEQFGLTEFQTGLLMTLNGLLIFALEMPFVGYFERKSTETEIILWGVYLCLLAFTCYQYLGRNTNY